MLKTKDLTFTYKSRKSRLEVFKNLNISFNPGFNVILGPNGAGKSTLLKSIFGLLKYDGSIWYGKESITSMTVDEKTEIMSYLPQIDVNNSSLSVLEMVLLGLLPELGRKIREEDIASVNKILQALNIGHLAPRSFFQLSGGQKKMVFIAQALVRNPRLVLLDEPVNSLDLQKQMELCYFLKEIIHKKAVSVILVLHDINLAARFADNLIVLDNDGQLYGSGSPREIIREEMLRKVYGVIASIHYDSEGTPTVSVIKSVNNIYPSNN